MRERTMKDSYCADCGGFDVEWMYKCKKHRLEYCRGCSCPECDRENNGERQEGDELFDWAVGNGWE